MGFPRWAPLTWYMFHKLANDYAYNESVEETDKEHYIQFFKSMKTIIPCKTCRNHFIENTNIEENKIENNITKEKIFEWTVRLHNLVNSMHKKKVFSVEEAKKLYTSPLPNHKLYAFINDYVMYNLNKGIEKDNELVNMLTHLCYIYPNNKKRENLIKFVETIPLKKDKLRSWLSMFYLVTK
jgi:hypothetical protein